MRVRLVLRGVAAAVLLISVSCSGYAAEPNALNPPRALKTPSILWTMELNRLRDDPGRRIEPPDEVKTTVLFSDRWSSSADRSKRLRQSQAFWKSLLVPGLGQLSMDRKGVGCAFLAAETALVGGLIGLRTYAARVEDDYQTFAFQHAGITIGHDHQFYVDAGNWMNERLYNDERLRERDFDALYNNPEDVWQWDCDAARAEFKRMRISSDRARNTAVMVVGGMILNHLFAAIDAARGASEKSSLSFAPIGTSGGAVVLSIRVKGK